MIIELVKALQREATAIKGFLETTAKNECVVCRGPANGRICDSEFCREYYRGKDF